MILDGTVECAAGGEEHLLPSPAVCVCGVGPAHRLRNAGTELTRLLRVRVQVHEPESAGGFSAQAVDADALTWRDAIHGGSGRLATRHMWSPEDFQSTWTFVDHAVLGEGASVGYHYHDGLEESFIVLSGRGWMTIDGDTFEVGSGSVTFQGIEEPHGIYNPGPNPLAFLRLAVGVPNETFTTIDLDDSLASRRP